MTKEIDLSREIESGLREAIDFRRGEIALDTRVVDPMSVACVREIRKAVAKSPKEFERRFGIRSRTLEGWEQGRVLDATARVLLLVIDKNPDVVERALG